MTKEEFLKKFTNKYTGKVELPNGAVLCKPNDNWTGTQGLYKDGDTYEIYQIGVPGGMGAADAHMIFHMYRTKSETDAFNKFYKLIKGKISDVGLYELGHK